MWPLCDIVPAGVGVEGDGERCIHGAGTPPAIPPSQHHLLIVTIQLFHFYTGTQHTINESQTFKTGIY